MRIKWDAAQAVTYCICMLNELNSFKGKKHKLAIRHDPPGYLGYLLTVSCLQLDQ